MIKTISLTGKELKVNELGGFNTVVHNLGDEAVYASKYPGISAEADNVAAIPAGAAKLVSTTNGTIYLLGYGKVELTGQDYEGVNCSTSSPAGFAAGTSDVSKAYVDGRDEATLEAANSYTDNALDSAKEDIGQKLSQNAEAISELRDKMVGKSELPTISNTNLLDNWYFADPINQRGKTQYTGAVYGIDRWRSTSGTLTVTVEKGEYINLTVSSTGQAYFRHLFERPISGVFTISILAKGSGSFLGNLLKDDGYAPSAPTAYVKDNWELYSWTQSSYELETPGFKQGYMRINAGSSIDIKAIKVEVGPVQTLARKEGDEWVLNDPPPNMALELTKCQRYYQIHSTNDIAAVDLRPAMYKDPTDIVAVEGGYAYVAEL